MKTGIVAVVVIAIIAAGGFALTRGGNDNKTASSGQTPNSSGQTSPVSSDTVTIQNFAFSPASITVKKGTSVTWTNKDSTAHQPVADSGNGPASPVLQPGQSYSFTYNQTGTFTYHCSIHPEMTGSVKVTDTSSASPQTTPPPAATPSSSSESTSPGYP